MLQVGKFVVQAQAQDMEPVRRERRKEQQKDGHLSYGRQVGCHDCADVKPISNYSVELEHAHAKTKTF